MQGLDVAIPFCMLARTKTERELMKKTVLAMIVVSSLALAASAETSLKLTNVHLCCGKCVTAAEKAAASVAGVTATGNKENGELAINAADAATAQKAVDAVVAAGFFGKSSDAAVNVTSTSGAKDEKVSSLTVKGTHLCCDKCAKGVATALAGVKGVTGNTAVKGAESFEIKGEFNAKEAISALEAAGYTGKVQ